MKLGTGKGGVGGVIVKVFMSATPWPQHKKAVRERY